MRAGLSSGAPFRDVGHKWRSLLDGWMDQGHLHIIAYRSTWLDDGSDPNCSFSAFQVLPIDWQLIGSGFGYFVSLVKWGRPGLAHTGYVWYVSILCDRYVILWRLWRIVWSVMWFIRFPTELFQNQWKGYFEGSLQGNSMRPFLENVRVHQVSSNAVTSHTLDFVDSCVG